MRILIVDEDALVCGLMQDILHRDGVDIDTAFRYAEAVRKIREFEYDAITVEYEVPGGTGFDLLEEIGRLKRPVPVVLMITGFANCSRVREEARRRGAHAVMKKPFRAYELLRRIYGGSAQDAPPPPADAGANLPEQRRRDRS